MTLLIGIYQLGDKVASKEKVAIKKEKELYCMLKKMSTPAEKSKGMNLAVLQ